jgi:hypothetical protein
VGVDNVDQMDDSPAEELSMLVAVVVGVAVSVGGDADDADDYFVEMDQCASSSQSQRFASHNHYASPG